MKAGVIHRVVQLLLAALFAIPSLSTVAAQDATPDDAPGLSYKALRWRGLGITDPDLDNYTKLDGTFYTGLGDSASDIDTSKATYKTATDHYEYTAGLTATSYQFTSIVAFPNATAAKNWIDDSFRRSNADRPAGATVKELPNAKAYGDDSTTLALTIRNADGTSGDGYALLVRSGKQVVAIAVISQKTLVMDVVAAMAEAQVTYFLAGNCAESVELPAKFAG